MKEILEKLIEQLCVFLSMLQPAFLIAMAKGTSNETQKTLQELALRQVLASQKGPISLNEEFLKKNGLIIDTLCPYGFSKGDRNSLVLLSSGGYKEIAFLLINGYDHAHGNVGEDLVFNDEHLSRYRLVCGCCGSHNYSSDEFLTNINKICAERGIKFVLVHGTDFGDKINRSVQGFKFLRLGVKDEESFHPKANLPKRISRGSLEHAFKGVFLHYGLGGALLSEGYGEEKPINKELQLVEQWSLALVGKKILVDLDMVAEDTEGTVIRIEDLTEQQKETRLMIVLYMSTDSKIRTLRVIQRVGEPCAEHFALITGEEKEIQCIPLVYTEEGGWRRLITYIQNSLRTGYSGPCL